LDLLKGQFVLSKIRLIGGSVGFLGVIEINDCYEVATPTPIALPIAPSHTALPSSPAALVSNANSFSLFQLALISLLFFPSFSLSRSTKEKCRMKLRGKKTYNKKGVAGQLESIIISYYSLFDCHYAFQLSSYLIDSLPSTGLV
jgi:hypothetical protein